MPCEQPAATRRPRPQRRALAEGVFLAMTGEDAVVLDLRTDSYGCLPGVADAIRLVDGGVEGQTGILADLDALGLLSAAAGPARRALPVLPTRELEQDDIRHDMFDKLTFLRTVRAARRLGPAASVQACLRALPPPPGRPPDPRRVAGLTETFKRLLPWTPGQGACLYRAFVLLSLLRRAGQDAAWVFGVRTWPFAAHCWLQVGDAVLDDEPERIAVYAPIMAV